VTGKYRVVIIHKANFIRAKDDFISTEFHRKLAKMKENLSGEQLSAEQLSMLHKLLLKCQELGDQKVELVTQVVNLLDAKAKQLVLDRKTIGNKNSATKLTSFFNLKTFFSIFFGSFRK
jgi:hypothetical protein